MDFELHRPAEPEERDWNKQTAHVGEGESELGFGFAFVIFGQAVEYGANARDDE